MNELLLNKNSKVYLCLKQNFATGGPELINQLAYKLNNRGINAFLYYYDNPKNNEPLIHESYKQYNNPYSLEIEDEKDNILIVPETKTELLYKYNNIQKVIWWLSVDNFESSKGGYKSTKDIIKKIVCSMRIIKKYNFNTYRSDKKIIHFTQSQYAKEFIKKRGGGESFMLSDYLNSDFIKSQATTESGKENIILFNPKKGLSFTRKIIDAAKDLTFVPIENMSPKEVKEKFLKAKIYIDFGNHPGKDRMPREAVISRCCIITSTLGSASNLLTDVPISLEYKFESIDKNIPLIINKLRNIMVRYEKRINDFKAYRDIIKNEEKIFDKEIKNIFRIK